MSSNLKFENGQFIWGTRPASAIEIAKHIQQLKPAPEVEGRLVSVSQEKMQIRIRIVGSFPEKLALERVIRHLGAWLPVHSTTDYVMSGHRVIPISEIPDMGEFPLNIRMDGPTPITGAEYLKLLAIDSLREWLVVDARDGILARSEIDFEAVKIPQTLKADLSTYQFIGFAFMKLLAETGLGALLADEMGLGKTLQAITVILSMEETDRILVVAPASLTGNWRREFLKFAPTIEPYFHIGPGRTRSPKKFSSNRLVVTSYELLVNDFGLINDFDWDLVVLDEAQYIRNPNATRSQKSKALRRRVSIAITGTPVENRLDDLRSIADFVLPNYLPRFEQSGTQTMDDWVEARAIGRLMSAITIRRDVADVALDLPERSDLFVSLETPISLEQLASDRGISLGSGINGQVLTSHAEDSGPAGENSFQSGAKWIYLKSRLEELESRKEKALIFFSYIASIDRASDAISAEFPGFGVDVITGSVGLEERMQTIDAFSAGPGPGVLLLQIDAAGTGLNITSANHVFFFCPNWNPAVTAQAAARAFRRGQERPVFVHHLYYENTVEEEQISRAEYKRQIAAEVREGMA